MRLLLKGWSFQQIAQLQERSRQLVTADIKVIERRWREAAVANFNEIRQAQLARLDLLEREAWECFERSKRPKRNSRDRRRQLPALSTRVFEDALEAAGEDEDEDDGPKSIRVELEHQESIVERDGDPRWLERIAWCIQERNKLYGLYPDKEDSTRREIETVSRVVVYLPPNSGGAPAQNAASVALPPPQDVQDPSPPAADQADVSGEDESEVWRPDL